MGRHFREETGRFGQLRTSLSRSTETEACRGRGYEEALVATMVAGS
jgi:hypothetical protein